MKKPTARVLAICAAVGGMIPAVILLRKKKFQKNKTDPKTKTP